jgi:osmotically-inducible protein OsmY
MTRSAALVVLPSALCGTGRNAVETTLDVLTQARQDFDLAEQVERALRATGYGFLRGIAVTVNAHLVILEGRVPTYHLKQIAQEAALSVPGARDLCNNLEVTPSS